MGTNMRKDRLKLESIEVRSFVLDKNTIYFVSPWYNLLFCMDATTGIVYDAIEIPGRAPLSRCRIFYIYKKDNSIYMILSRPEKGIIRFDIDKGNMDVVNSEIEPESWGDNADEDDSYIYIPVINKKEFARISKHNYEMDYINVPIEEKGISVLHKCKDRMYMVAVSTGNIIELTDCGEKRIYDAKPRGYRLFNSNYPASGIFSSGGKIVVFSRCSNMSYVTTEINQNAVILGPVYDENNEKDEPLISASRKTEKGIIVYHNKCNKWLWLDLDLTCTKECTLRFSDEVMKRLENASLFLTNNSYMEIESKYNNTLERFVATLSKM